MTRGIQKIGTALAYAFPVMLLLIFRFLLQPVIFDDAFISFRTAVNLGDGNGMVFNLGERVYLVTTPLWVLLLSSVRMLVSDVIIAANVLGLIFEVLFLAGIVHLGRVIFGDWKVGLLAGVLTCTNPVFLLTSFSGMEIPLYLFLVILAFVLLADNRFTWSLLVASFAVWTRTDGLLLYLILLVWVIYSMVRNRKFTKWQLIAAVLPSIAVLAGYFFFGLLYYGDIVPTSVQLKLGIGPGLFSLRWLYGVGVLVLQFARTFTGNLSFWFIAITPLLLMLIPIATAIFKFKVADNRKATPLLVFTVLYALSFISSGNTYANQFPWYFIPILPGLYILSAWGCVHLITIVVPEEPGANRNKNGERQILKSKAGKIIFTSGLVALVTAIIWSLLMVAPIVKDYEHLSDISSEREQVYAASVIWLGNYLERESIIAANEIGAIGFFTRPDIKILDMFGILRTREDRDATEMEMIRKHHPEVILVRQIFPYREWIENEMGDEYTWSTFRTIELGLRSDIASGLVEHLDEIEEIYLSLELNREYDWDGKVFGTE